MLDAELQGKETTMSDNTETAILAGGCFWGVQELLRRRDGVLTTRVGYTGGENDHPTYRNHPGHAEAVEIVFDPERISYRDILEFLFQIHDPTTKDRQGNDIGSSYRSEVFHTSEAQRRVAEDTIADVDASRLWPGKGGDGGQRGADVLGGRARAPGLPPALPGRLQLPLPAARLEAAAPRDRGLILRGRTGFGGSHAAPDPLSRDHGLVCRRARRDGRQRRAAGDRGGSRRWPCGAAVGLERLPAGAGVADPHGRIARGRVRRAARVLDRRLRLRRVLDLVRARAEPRGARGRARAPGRVRRAAHAVCVSGDRDRVSARAARRGGRIVAGMVGYRGRGRAAGGRAADRLRIVAVDLRAQRALRRRRDGARGDRGATAALARRAAAGRLAGRGAVVPGARGAHAGADPPAGVGLGRPRRHPARG